MIRRFTTKVSVYVAAALLIATPSSNARELADGVRWSAPTVAVEIPTFVDVNVDVSDLSEGHGVVVLQRKIEYTISRDSVNFRYTRVYRYVSEEGLRDFGNPRSYFNTATDDIDIEQAMVIDSTGELHVVDPGTVQILPSDVYDVFSDSRYVLVPLSGLDVGATAVLVSSKTTDRNSMVGCLLYTSPSPRDA